MVLTPAILATTVFHNIVGELPGRSFWKSNPGKSNHTSNDKDIASCGAGNAGEPNMTAIRKPPDVLETPGRNSCNYLTAREIEIKARLLN